VVSTDANERSIGMVEKQALQDLHSDAEFLGAIVIDQAEKLGRIRTAKAIRIFGQVGSAIAEPQIAPLQKAPHQTILGMLSAKVLKVVFACLMMFVRGVQSVVGMLQMNWIFLAIIALLFASNLQLATKTGMAYWNANRANWLAENIQLQKSRAIYIKDLEETTSVGHRVTGPGSASNLATQWYVFDHIPYHPAYCSSPLHQLRRVLVADIILQFPQISKTVQLS